MYNSAMEWCMEQVYLVRLARMTQHDKAKQNKKEC